MPNVRVWSQIVPSANPPYPVFIAVGVRNFAVVDAGRCISRASGLTSF